MLNGRGKERERGREEGRRSQSHNHMTADFLGDLNLPSSLLYPGSSA